MCVVCGEDGGILKCPAESKQKSGAEIYRNFLESFFKDRSFSHFASEDTGTLSVNLRLLCISLFELNVQEILIFM